jgi:hypothetical protein
MAAANEAVWRNGSSSPREVQCEFGSLSPARSSVETATTPSRWDVGRNAWAKFSRDFNSVKFDNAAKNAT